VASVHDPGRADALGRLMGFRRNLYRCLTARRDALFELVDALTCRPGRVDSLPALTLEPESRRGHGSLYGALTAGQIGADRLRRLLLSTVAAGRDGLVWFAGDVSSWPRPDAACSPGRLATYDKSARTLGGRPVTSGWPYAVLAGLEWGPTSWTAPVDAVRLTPTTSLTEVTLTQIERACAGMAALSHGETGHGETGHGETGHGETGHGETGHGETGRGETLGFVFDAEYDLMALSHAVAGRAHIVGRLRSNQVFRADPDPGAGRGSRGRPRRHGPAIKLNDPASLGPPDRTAEIDSPRYGRVRLAAWDHRHRKLRREGYWADHEGPLPIVAGSVIRVQIQRLSGKGGPPTGPMWLWHAGPTPLDLVTVFAVYQRRFDLEHTFRFLKQDLGWTVPAPLHPETADHWTWLVLAAYTQLRLARPICHDLRLPWEKPADPGRISPRRVRRDFRRVHALLGTPANPPKPSRPGPGRPRGSTRPPRPQHPTHRKHNRAKPKHPKTTTKIKPKG
jgi:DDE superfamily endonuclease